MLDPRFSDTIYLVEANSCETQIFIPVPGPLVQSPMKILET